MSDESLPCSDVADGQQYELFDETVGDSGCNKPLPVQRVEDDESGEQQPQRGDPQHAPDDLYAQPRDAKQAAACERQDQAAAQILREGARGRKWKSFPKDIRRRFGLWAMRQIYPAVLTIFRGGRGLVFKGGVLTPEFIRALKGRTNRAAFIETAIPVPGGRPVRLDLFEVDFLAGVVEVSDLTTSFRPDHLAKTGRYGRALFTCWACRRPEKTSC